MLYQGTTRQTQVNDAVCLISKLWLPTVYAYTHVLHFHKFSSAHLSNETCLIYDCCFRSLESYLHIEKALTNLTKETNENVHLKCEVRGHPQPSVMWYKNEAPIEQEKGKIQVRHNVLAKGKVRSRLFIKHLDTHDTGFYKCEATNGIKTIESVGVLIVRAGNCYYTIIIMKFNMS